MGTPPPPQIPAAGPIHNMPPLNSFRHNNGKARLAMNAMSLDGLPTGYYQQHHQGQGPPYVYGNKAMGVHNQLPSNEYYGKYEIEFNHQMNGAPGPVVNNSNNNNHMDGSLPFNHHPPLHGNKHQHHSQQQQIHGMPAKHSDFVNAQSANHKMLNEFNNKAAVQFNNQSAAAAAAYYNNQNVNPHVLDGPEHSHPQPYAQQHQQAQFHHQNYHLHNHHGYDSVDPGYYHHHSAGHHGTPIGVVGGGNKVGNNFYEANNNSIGYQHEFAAGDLSFQNQNHHHNHHVNNSAPAMAHPVGATGASSVEGAAPQNTYSQQQQAQFGFEGAQSYGHPGGLQQHNGPPIHGD